jgi:uncharacterized protein (DUF4415 family)
MQERKLTPEQQEDFDTVSAMRDEDIDFSDIPEVTDWTGAKRGMFYRPVKHAVSLRLDADIIAWFKDHATAGEKYQTAINRVLRKYVVTRGQDAVSRSGSSGARAMTERRVLADQAGIARR